MRNIDPSFVRTSIGLVALSAFLALAQPSQAAITFLGTGSISGSATDKSGLTGTYTPGGTDYKAQLGALRIGEHRQGLFVQGRLLQMVEAVASYAQRLLRIFRLPLSQLDHRPVEVDDIAIEAPQPTLL